MHRREPNPKFKNIFFRNVFLEVCPKIPVYATGFLGLHFYIDAAPKLLTAVHLLLTSPGPGSTIYKYIESFNALVTVPCSCLVTNCDLRGSAICAREQAWEQPGEECACTDVCTLATPGGRQSTLALEASGPNDTRLY